MENKVRTVVFVALALCSSERISYADLWWGNTGAISNINGVAIAAHDTDPTIGAFAQLIRITDGTPTPSAFVLSGNGVSGNDEVYATAHAGQGDDLFINGIFPFQLGVIGEEEDYYYVRVFDAPQATLADWNLGVDAPIPASSQYYYESSAFNYTHNEFVQSDFDFAQAGGQTLNLVPEPSVFVLCLAGATALRLLVRRRLAT